MSCRSTFSFFSHSITIFLSRASASFFHVGLREASKEKENAPERGEDQERPGAGRDCKVLCASCRPHSQIFRLSHYFLSRSQPLFSTLPREAKYDRECTGPRHQVRPGTPGSKKTTHALSRRQWWVSFSLFVYLALSRGVWVSEVAGSVANGLEKSGTIPVCGFACCTDVM